jgi:hypothetical protein
MGKEKMEGEASVSLIQVICDHAKHRTYNLRSFDILKGFELNETRCFNCQKIVATYQEVWVGRGKLEERAK